MKRSSRCLGVLAAALVTMFASSAMADADEDAVTARLIGYQETPATINSAGSGEFRARIHDQTSIEFELTYRDLSSTALQSHIHFGRPATTGGVVLFLCTNLGNAPTTVPTPQACPPFPATIKGTLTAADVIAVPGQGIDTAAAGFAEMLKAIRAGAAYANVHTTLHPSGEIRGLLNSRTEEHDR